jgi:hypothetical protein
MTAYNYDLGDDASLLDRATLRAFAWWRGSGRDFARAYLLTQLALAAILAAPLTAVPSSTAWNLIGALAAIVAPVAAWAMHRRRFGWRAPYGNLRAVRWGIGLGILLFLGTGVFLMVVIRYVGVLIGMLSAQGPLALLPAIGTGVLGWAAAAYRKHRLDDPIYPIETSLR